MANNDYVIKSNDPEAIPKLKERLEAAQKYQEFMKKVNAFYKEHGTVKGFEGFDDKLIADKDAYGEKYGAPYPDFAIKNNYGKIKQIEERIARVEYEQNVGFVGWDFNGGNVVANKEINRLQLFFGEKPDDATRAKLKDNGFRWSGKNKAWQRQLTQNAISACDRIDFLKPTDGRRPTEHQPKPPAKQTEQAR